MKIACISITSKEYDKKHKVHQASIEKYFPESYVIKYSPDEFKSEYTNTLQHILASRPEAILKTFEQGYNTVVFLGADVVFYNPPKEFTLFNTANHLNAMFFPHIIESLPDDGKFPSNEGISRTGHINSDLTIWKNNPDTIKFLTWCKEMMVKKCIDTNNIFYDQTWLNFAPFLLKNVVINRNPKYNIAYWNIRQRNEYLKDMVCMQYSGFDENNPGCMSIHQNRYTANEEELKYFKDYAEKIK